jgi:alkylation response protein AidB-like acyl-CoA dehydrogenase
VGRERVEDLDVDGAQGEVGVAARAYESRRAEAQGTHRVHRRHAPAWRGGPADPQHGGRVGQGVAELVVELMGAQAMLCGPYTRGNVDEPDVGRRDPVLAFVASPSATIAGGTTEIQLNILGERVLGLPRELGFDPEMPWSRIPRN